MSRTPSTPRWKRRAEERPQELLDSALSVFVERGYAAASMDEIAKRAGVTKGTLYLYFPGKVELLKSVVRQALIVNLTEAQSIASHHTGGNWALLSLFLTEFTQRISRTSISGIPKLIISESGNFPEIAKFYYEEVVQQGQRLITDILKRGIACGEFRPIDTDYAWRMIVAPLIFGVFWKHAFLTFDPDSLDFERYLKCQLDLIYHALKNKDGTSPDAQTDTPERTS